MAHHPAHTVTRPIWDTPSLNMTDEQIAEVMPSLSLEDRIGLVIRKYVGGGMSYYDGETAAGIADTKITKHLLGKLRPWLP